MTNTSISLKAASDLTRLRILMLLIDREACVCELMSVFRMAQSKLSHHLIILRNAGFLVDRKEGRWNYYRLALQELSSHNREIILSLNRLTIGDTQRAKDLQSLNRSQNIQVAYNYMVPMSHFSERGTTMNTPEQIKKTVQDKYRKIASGEITVEPQETSCQCGSNLDDLQEVVINISEKYSDEDRRAIPDGSDLGLGCGTPAAFADIREGMTVLDLGSGAGIDCFVAARHVGQSGRVIGVDMTDEMIAKAEANKKKINAHNVEFRLGEIEQLPVDDNSVDRVLSNCVINLVPDKEKAFHEIYRVLKPGGSFSVSDIIIDGEISEEERHNAALWAGCISGALPRTQYLGAIERAGFSRVHISSEKRYDYPLRNAGGIFSITVTGTK